MCCDLSSTIAGCVARVNCLTPDASAAHALPSSIPGQPAIPLTRATSRPKTMGKSKSIPDPTWTDPSAEKHWLWNRVYKLPNRRERNHHSPVWEHLTDCLKRGPKLLASDGNITAEMILPHRKCAGTKRPHGFVVNCSASPASFQHHTGQAERKQSLAFCRDVLHEIRCAPTQSRLVPL